MVKTEEKSCKKKEGNMEKPYGIIYKVSFPNGKVYIGQTIRELKERKKQHFRDSYAKKRKGKKLYPFQSALLKYDKKDISWEIIDTANNQKELDEKEIKWIAFYRSCTYFEDCKGYNCELGGNGGRKSHLSSEEFIELGNDFNNGMTKKEISEKYNISYGLAVRICNERKWEKYININNSSVDISRIIMNPEKVDEILELFMEKGNLRQVARIAGVDSKTVECIVKGKSWKNHTLINNLDFYEKYRRFSKWTKEDLELIAKLYNEGKNDEEIYNIIKDINPFNIRKGEIVEITSGRRFSSITNLKQIKRGERKRKFTKKIIEEMFEDFDNNIKGKDFIEKYKCSKGTFDDMRKLYKQQKQ